MIKLEKDHKVRVLYLGSVHIGGDIKCETGLHIGDSDDSIKIGGIDKFVIKDPISNKPYIPGSSLKGKSRAMMEKSMGKIPNRESDNIWRYEVDDINDAITDKICRIYGSSSKDKSQMNFPSRLIMRDCFIKNTTNSLLEKKSENVIDRISGQAVPRTNERVSRGAEFNLDADYNVEVIIDHNNVPLLGNDASADYWKILIEDLHSILDSFILIEKTYLGGNGSRGYGKVKFNPSFEAKTKNEILGLSFPQNDVSNDDLIDHILPDYNNESSFYELRVKIIDIAKKFKQSFEEIIN